jgi:hypothetical protein
MEMVLVALMVAGCLPVSLAIWANRRTSLLHALTWALIAWLSWSLAFLLRALDAPHTDLARTGALCLTGCAGVAVLGARRPHVFAWNFVVAGLFVVMALPLVETQIIGAQSFDGLRRVFLAGTIAVGALNYLPTRLGPSAVLLLGSLVGEWLAGDAKWDWLLAGAPWLAWLGLAWRIGVHADIADLDRLWLNFRDRWGLVWGQRVREQFNHAAQNAGWPVHLSWWGLVWESNEPVDEAKLLATLRAILKRFLAND